MGDGYLDLVLVAITKRFKEWFKLVSFMQHYRINLMQLKKRGLRLNLQKNLWQQNKRQEHSEKTDGLSQNHTKLLKMIEPFVPIVVAAVSELIALSPLKDNSIIQLVLSTLKGLKPGKKN